MKKYVSILCVAALVSTLFAGCGEKTSNGTTSSTNENVDSNVSTENNEETRVALDAIMSYCDAKKLELSDNSTCEIVDTDYIVYSPIDADNNLVVVAFDAITFVSAYSAWATNSEPIVSLFNYDAEYQDSMDHLPHYIVVSAIMPNNMKYQETKRSDSDATIFVNFVNDDLSYGACFSLSVIRTNTDLIEREQETKSYISSNDFNIGWMQGETVKWACNSDEEVAQTEFVVLDTYNDLYNINNVKHITKDYYWRVCERKMFTGIAPMKGMHFYIANRIARNVAFDDNTSYDAYYTVGFQYGKCVASLDDTSLYTSEVANNVYDIIRTFDLYTTLAPF